LWDVVLSGLITGICGTIPIFFIYRSMKKGIKTEAFQLICDAFDTLKAESKEQLELWLNSETGAKALYGIGVYIGNGAKSGIGLGNKGGKFKFDDLIAQAGSQFLQNMFTPQGQNQQKISQPNGGASRPPQVLNRA